MLVLTRKPRESIVIDGGIEIHVLEVRSDKVKLGFSAPLGVSIQRAEVARRGSNGQTTPPTAETSPTEDLAAGVMRRHNLHGGG